MTVFACPRCAHDHPVLLSAGVRMVRCLGEWFALGEWEPVRVVAG